MPPLRFRAGAVLALLAALLAAWVLFTRLDTLPSSSSWIVSPPGRLVDVGGFRLHLHCQGEAQPGVPVVVLEAGGGDYSAAWEWVLPELASETMTCAYDRAGYGWTDPGPRPRTAKRMAAELHALLANAEIPPPYVLVAHSFGGFPARRFAVDYPHETAGLVLVDATDETTPFFTPVLTVFSVGLRIEALRTALNPQSSLRLGRPHGRSLSTFSAELFALPATIRQVRSAPEDLGDLPLFVISASYEPETDQVTMVQRDVMTQWSRNSRYLFIESGHAIHQEHPEVVVQAVRTLLSPFRPAPLTGQE